MFFPWGKVTIALQLIKFESICQKMLCYLVWLNWVIDSGEKDFKVMCIWIHCFLFFPFGNSQCYYAILLLYPLRKGCDPSFKYALFPSREKALWQVWIKLAQCFMSMYFRTYLPFKEGVAVHLHTLIQECLSQCLAEIAPVQINVVNIYSLFCYYFLVAMWQGSSFVQSCIFFTT